MTVLATAVPHAPFEQSLIPKPKFTLLHKHEGSGELHPRDEYCPIRLLKQSWPHDGNDEISGNVVVDDDFVAEVLVFVAEELVVVFTELVGFAVEEVVDEELITLLHVPYFD